VARVALTSEQALAVLAETPRRIAELTAGLAPDRLRTRPLSEEWSANEVLAHLRSCADVWGEYMARILAEDGPTIRAVNPRRYIDRTDYPDRAFRPSLRSFTTQRAELLALLEPLPPGSWAREATVTGAGSPLRLTVLSYADRMARHERAHVTQIATIAAALR
jgi:hypothetical protein